MLSDTLKEIIFSRLGTLRTSPKGWMTCDCKVCIYRGHSADTRGRFGIMTGDDGTISAHCFNCALKVNYTPRRLLNAKFVEFLKQLGVSDDDLKKLKFEAFREKEAGDNYKPKSVLSDPRLAWSKYELPADSFSVMSWLEMGLGDSDFLQVAEYCLHRKINVNDVLWSPETSNQMNKRFIIPYVYRGNVVGYTARYYEDKTPSKAVSRYYGHAPSDFVFNLDKQLSDKPFIIVCEGVLDGYYVEGVSTLGAINNEQADIIDSFKKRVIVCPDRDKEGDSLVDMAIEREWDVCFPRWDSDIKDVGNAVQRYGRLLTLKTMLSSTIQDPVKIKLKRKMDKFDGK